MSVKKVIIVGGVAGGMSTAARLRRLNEGVEIVVYEREGDISIATCGMPSYLGNEISDRAKLSLFNAEKMKNIFNIDVKIHHEVLSIDTEKKTVSVRNLKTGVIGNDSYDKLVLSPGANPIRGIIPGDNHEMVFTLRNLKHMDAIYQKISVSESVAVVGAGFIGLEVVEAMVTRGLTTHLIEMFPQVFPPMDQEMATAIEFELINKGINVLTSTKVEKIEEMAEKKLKLYLSGERSIEVDFVVLCIGVQPETQLAESAGLQLGVRKAIKVNPQMRTSDPHIYACGDAVENVCTIRKIPIINPLAGPANRQGRVIAANICGRYQEFRGVHNTSIIRAFDFSAANTGLNEKTVLAHGIPYRKVYSSYPSNAMYLPGWSFISMKLIFNPIDGRILGAQACGRQRVQRLIERISASIEAGGSVYDISEAELCYAPPFGSAKDLVNHLGFMASNMVQGLEYFVQYDELVKMDESDIFFLDVREPQELIDEGEFDGGINIPLCAVRRRVEEIPRDKHVIVACRSGMRAHHVTCMLRNIGYPRVSVFMGGIFNYHYHKKSEVFLKMLKDKIY